MDAILDTLSRGLEQLIARADGPLHFRLVTMPTVVTILAIRAGLRDAREGNAIFLWTLLTRPGERARLVRSAFSDVGRVFCLALIMDATYQVFVFGGIYPVQLLIVAVACAIVPYVLVRGPVTRIARFLSGPTD